MDGFEGLTSAFNIDNVENQLAKVQSDLETIVNRKELVETKVKNPLVFQDQDYIRTELKTLIMSTRTVQYKVEQDMKIGMDNRTIEVYAKLIESIGKLYNSLMELNKSIFDAQIQTGQLDIQNIGSNKISLSSDQLLDMINKASEGSQMNAIVADFEVEDTIHNKKNE